MNGALLWVWFALAAPPASGAPGATMPVAIKVISDSDAARKSLRDALVAEMAGYRDRVSLKDDPQQAVSTLWVYAQQTTEGKNPKGYAIAVVHTSSLITRALTLKLRDLAKDERCGAAVTSNTVLGESMEDLVEALATTYQPVRHINVAALDALEPAQVRVVARALVANFVTRERGK